ncbi:MAG: type II toxin-antitoxin system RelE/ParE family toxin [Thermoleophilia bacterium]
MRRRVRFDAAAEVELNEAADYYDLESPGLGSVFLDEVERAMAQVTAFPDAATPVHAGVRQRLLTKFPYTLLYSLRGDEIRILAVAHQKRRPFYWRGRQ